jgi:hypothetical protein
MRVPGLDMPRADSFLQLLRYKQQSWQMSGFAADRMVVSLLTSLGTAQDFA